MVDDNKNEDWEDVEMAVDRKELSRMQEKLQNMTPEQRRSFLRNRMEKICDRNDTALRKLSKS